MVQEVIGEMKIKCGGSKNKKWGKQKKFAEARKKVCLNKNKKWRNQK